MKKIKILIPVMFVIGAGMIIILSFGIVYLPIGTLPSNSPIIIDCTDGDDVVEIIDDASNTFSIYLNGYLCNIIILTKEESSMDYTCNIPVHINLGEGNDTCTISWFYPGALTIVGGPGSDIIIPDDYNPPDISSLSLQVPDSSRLEVKGEEQQQYEKKLQNNEARLMTPIDSPTSTGLENSDVAFPPPMGYTYKAWVLIGGEGNDILVGGPGDDFLLGGLGNDLLYLRVGTDTGIDRFGYNTFLTYGNTDVIIED